MSQDGEKSGGFSAFYNIVKLLAACVGLFGTLLVLMTLVGMFSDNLWVQLGVAAVVAVAVPLVIAEFALPEDVTKGRGIVTEVFAVLWMAGAMGCVLVAPTMTDAFANESKVLGQVHPMLGSVTRWVSGATAPETSPETVAKSDVETPDKPAEKEANPTPIEKKPGEVTGDAVDDQELPKMTPVELFKTYAPSVVTIEIDGGRGGGTGFVLDTKGTIATNQHVVGGAKKIRVKFFEGDWVDDVEVLVEDKDVDLAVLRVAFDGTLKPVRLGDSDTITVGEPIVSIGNPLGLEHTLTDGLVSARRVWRDRKWIQMSVPVSPGNSGGPIFNSKGVVLGVTTAKIGNAFNRGENLNLAVPINVLREIIRGGFVPSKSSKSTSW